ncbi:MAG: neutral zinc metallopeptidase [Acidimicrobiales bacterium]|nr:neutral zinc metallopeptidase [Acidimicrobiales bacterium]
MDFDDKARLDTSQIRDLRAGGGRSRGKTAAIGGGGLGLVGVIITLLVTVLGGGGGGGLSGGNLSQLFPEQPVSVGVAEGDNAGLESQCRTGADAETQRDCRIVAVVNSVQDFWAEEFARRGGRYEQAPTTFFAGAVDTACGQASADVGPFYCPADSGVYIDLTFYDELRTRFGAEGGDFAEAYVIAHEYGHHIQNLTGQNDRVRTRQGPDSDAVRLELQADCYAGLWANRATTVADPQTGTPLVVELTDEDIAQGLDAAATVGDDYIQKRFQGQVSPEAWTHGSSAQRQRWFTTGLRTGDMERCDTFSAEQL